MTASTLMILSILAIFAIVQIRMQNELKEAIEMNMTLKLKM